jgi:hypothetical protein
MSYKALLLRGCALGVVFVIGVAASDTTTYSYDSLGRLTKTTISGGPNNGRTDALCFDPASNRTLYYSGTGAAPTCPATPTPSPAPAPAPTPTPAPTPNQAPTCNTLNVGPIPGFATTTVSVTAAMILGQCSDPDGDTLSVASPAVPYTIQVLGNSQPITATNTVTDGRGGSATMTIQINRS